TVAVEPFASAIWDATVRFQMRSYNFQSLPRSVDCNSLGVRNVSPEGRIASCASWALLFLPEYRRGDAGTVSAPYRWAAWVRAALMACWESVGESVRIYVM